MIIIDQSGLDLGDIRDTKVICITNLNLASLVVNIRHREIDITPFKTILIHVGTNDIAEGTAVGPIQSQFEHLLSVIRRENFTVNIMISALLPRPVDEHYTRVDVKHLNDNLLSLCARNHIAYVPSFRPFLFRGVANLKKFNIDRMTLSREGSADLTQIFRHSMSSSNHGTLLRYARRHSGAKFPWL